MPDQGNENDSVHLCEYPMVNGENTQMDILNEVDTVILIVSLGRSARNKANIKIHIIYLSNSIYKRKNKIGAF